MHLTTEFPPLVYGGLGTAVGALASANARGGMAVSVLLVGSEGDPSYQAPKGVPAASAPVTAVASEVGIHVVRASHHLSEPAGIQWARTWRPNVLHLHSFWLWPIAEAIRANTGVPIVYTVHSLDRAEYEIGQGPPECLTQWDIQHCAIARADAVVALTQAESELIETYVPGTRARVHIVGNGIDVSKVSMASVSRRCRSSADVTVLFSGRFVERKGMQELLAAIPRVLERRPNVRFVLAGGYRGCSSEAIARRWFGAGFEPYSDRVYFPGWLDADAMADWYSRADILVVPSWYEPFGMVVLEGMLYGLAVAASDVGGPREILEHGVTGLLFQPRDANALAAAIGRLVDSRALRNGLGRRAASHVRDRWCYDRVMTQMHAVYSKVSHQRDAARLANSGVLVSHEIY